MKFVGQKNLSMNAKESKVIIVTNDNTASNTNIFYGVKKQLEKVQEFMGTVSDLTPNRIKIILEEFSYNFTK